MQVPSHAGAGTPAEAAIIGSVEPDRVSFGLLTQGEPQPSACALYPTASMHTFSEALQRYSRDSGVPLQDRRLAIAVAGPVSGDTVRVTNGRWFISINGLAAMTGRRPEVLNDVAAVAWSTLALAGSDLRSLSSPGSTRPSRPARQAIIWMGEGLGAACLVLESSGATFVLDGEAGHMTCGVDGPEGELLARLPHLTPAFASYERVLGEARRLPTGAPGRADQSRYLASRVLGRFAGNVVLAYGAWAGLFLAGPGVRTSVPTGGVGAFLSELQAKGRFARALESVPVWVIGRDDLPILGAAAFMNAMVFGRTER